MILDSETSKWIIKDKFGAVDHLQSVIAEYHLLEYQINFYEVVLERHRERLPVPYPTPNDGLEFHVGYCSALEKIIFDLKEDLACRVERLREWDEEHPEYKVCERLLID